MSALKSAQEDITTKRSDRLKVGSSTLSGHRDLLNFLGLMQVFIEAMQNRFGVKALVIALIALRYIALRCDKARMRYYRTFNFEKKTHEKTK